MVGIGVVADVVSVVVVVLVVVVVSVVGVVGSASESVPSKPLPYWAGSVVVSGVVLVGVVVVVGVVLGIVVIVAVVVVIVNVAVIEVVFVILVVIVGVMGCVGGAWSGRWREGCDSLFLPRKEVDFGEDWRGGRGGQLHLPQARFVLRHRHGGHSRRRGSCCSWGVRVSQWCCCLYRQRVSRCCWRGGGPRLLTKFGGPHAESSN